MRISLIGLRTKDRSFGEIDLLFENRIRARKFTKADRKFPCRISPLKLISLTPEFADLHDNGLDLPAGDKKIETEHLESA
jgi:hypothetical protein